MLKLSYPVTTLSVLLLLAVPPGICGDESPDKKSDGAGAGVYGAGREKPVPEKYGVVEAEKPAETGTGVYGSGREVHVPSGPEYQKDAGEYLYNALKEAEASGPDDTRIPSVLRDMAKVFIARKEYAKAEAPLKRVIKFYETNMNPDHPDVADSLRSLADVYIKEGKYSQAGPLLKRGLAIYKKWSRKDYPYMDKYLANINNSLGILYLKEKKYSEAEPHFKEALKLREMVLGRDDREVGNTLKSYAELLSLTGRKKEADQMDKRAESIFSIP